VDGAVVAFWGVGAKQTFCSASYLFMLVAVQAGCGDAGLECLFGLGQHLS